MNPAQNNHLPPPNRRLTPPEELAYIREIYGPENEKALERVLKSYDILQARSQMLVSLIAICLTVTGFSGPAIARASTFCRYSIVIGLLLVLISAVFTLAGPLQLRWATQWRADTIENSLINLIRRRNQRTARYHLSFLLLSLGLSAYGASVIAYLLQGAPQ